jgi:aryl-alcohol dehydrogenase-like predicted oxidoreductase
MEFRQLGGSGLKVPVLSLGTTTPIYPYWHQRGFERNPPLVKL